MAAGTPDILEASRLPALARGVCLYAGLPLPPATAPGERFVIRSGSEPPQFIANLLVEAFTNDGIEVSVLQVEEDSAEPHRIEVRPGFAGHCPGEELRKALACLSMLFAVEHYGATGRLLGVTWAALPEDEPPPQSPYRAAVMSCEFDAL